MCSFIIKQVLLSSHCYIDCDSISALSYYLISALIMKFVFIAITFCCEAAFVAWKVSYKQSSLLHLLIEKHSELIKQEWI